MSASIPTIRLRKYCARKGLPFPKVPARGANILISPTPNSLRWPHWPGHLDTRKFISKRKRRCSQEDLCQRDAPHRRDEFGNELFRSRTEDQNPQPDGGSVERTLHHTPQHHTVAVECAQRGSAGHARRAL